MLDFASHFTEGVARFNTRRFWDAHESWEELWLEAETDLHQYLQGLIQLAAAYHHVQRGTLRGAVRLFDAALARLEPFPLVHCGVDRGEAVAAARRHREWTAERVARGELVAAGEDFDYPTLRLAEESPMPSQSW